MTLLSLRTVARLGAVSAVLVAGALTAPAAYASPATGQAFARYAGNAPVVAAGELSRDHAPGFYRVRSAKNAADTITVYWMPRGTARSAPAAIRATPAYRDTLAAEFASSEVAIFSPGAIGFYNPSDPSVMSHCYDGWFCLWEHSGWGGDHVRFQSTGYWQHLSNYGFNDKTSSVKNRRNNDSKLSQHIDGNENPGGTIRCYDSNSSVSYVGDGFNDEASGLKNYASDGQC